MVGTVRRLEGAITEGFAASYAVTALCGLADDTNKGYVHKLRRYAARIRKQPGASARQSLDDQLLHLAQTTNSESSIKKLLSGIRLLEKLRWAPSTVSAGDWLFVKGVEEVHEKAGKLPFKTWASLRVFADMCRLARGAADWELCAMATVSISFGLRAVEAVSVSFDGEHVTFTGAKGRKGRHVETPGTWAASWGRFLQMLRARHGYPPGRAAWHTSRVALHKGLSELVGRPESNYKALRWHSWRRFGAAQLRLLGAPTNSILRWGGLGNPQHAQGLRLPAAQLDFLARRSTTLRRHWGKRSSVLL